MIPERGLFVVLEGSDGSGKGTQLKVLAARLEAVGYEVETFDFPQYDRPSSHFVKKYLNGEYGPASEINPYAASMFYALDRYEAAPSINKALADNKVVLCNRYAGSNMAHQGSKFATEAQRRGFFIWADSLEFQLLGIPRPHINLYLRVPPEISYSLIASKAKRDYTANSRDEHENDMHHLNEAVATYDLLCNLFPKDFTAIDCAPDGNIMPITKINDLVWDALRPYLHSSLSRKDPSAVSIQLNEPSGPKESAQIQAAAVEMHRHNSYTIKLADMSLASLSQIAGVGGTIVSIPDSQYKRSRPKYFIPPNVKPGFRKKITKYFTHLNESQRLLQQTLKKHPASQQTRAISSWIKINTQPMALQVNAELKIPLPPALLGQKLALSPLSEIKFLASALSKQPLQAQKATPRGNFMDIAAQAPLGDAVNLCQLMDYWPRNEIAILSHLDYSSSGINATSLLSSLSDLNYRDKTQMLKKHLAEISSTEQLARQPWYEFEVLVSWSTFQFMNGQNLAEFNERQPANPRFGYTTPTFLDELGLVDIYLECYDKSLELYSDLQSAGQESLAIYSTLAGHRSRAIIRLDYSQIVKLEQAAKASPTPELTELYGAIYEAITEVHPLFSKYLATGQNTQADAGTVSVAGQHKSAVTGKKRPVNRSKVSKKRR